MTDAASLRSKAEQCRRLSRGISNPRAVAELEALARTFEAKAAAAERTLGDGHASAPRKGESTLAGEVCAAKI